MSSGQVPVKAEEEEDNEKIETFDIVQCLLPFLLVFDLGKST